MRVLDVGCGTGRFTAILVGSADAVIGVDREEAMLGVAARRLPDSSLVAAEAESLPFGDGQFDVAAAVCVLEFTTDPARAIAEIARVVRPGGKLVLGTLNTLSPWGLAHRRRLRRTPWTEARFLRRRRIRSLAAHHGTVHVRGFLFAPVRMPCASLPESIGRLVAQRLGAFQVTTITKTPG